MSEGNSTATVLVVDDDRGMLRLIEKGLFRDGFQPVTAASGREAIEWLACHRADLMLLDLKLSDIEGGELLNQLAALDRSIPFVIITGQGDERMAVEMMKRGAVEYLVKDVQFLEMLPAIVRRAIERQGKERKLADAEMARSQAEDAMRSGEERLRWALQGAQGGAWDWNLKTGEAWWSAEMYELWGLPPGTPVRLDNSLAGVHTDDVARVRQAVDQALVGDAGYQCEYRIHHPTRGERWITAHGKAIRDANGESIRLAGICFDVTERKRTEEALRQSEQALSTFFAEAPVGLIWVRPDGTVQKVNESQLEQLGRAAPEVIDRNISGFGAGKELKAILEAQAASAAGVRNHRTHFQRADGSIRHVLIDARPVLEGKRLVRSEWFVRDITRRVELEREILNISERERRRFGQDLHDDLCQTLSGIGYRLDSLTQELESRSKSGAREARRIADSIRKTARHAREMARGLAPVYVEADGLASALKDLAKRTTDLYDIACRFECPEPVQIDYETMGIHLYRISQEAVGNAVKHGRPRVIEIRLIRTNHHIVLGVRDDGRGLPKRSRNSKGMGLRIMDYRAGVIGGSLAIQRCPEGGTEVVCTIRLTATSGS